MSQNNQERIDEIIEKQKAVISEKQKQESIRQIVAIFIFAFIAYMLMNFNTSWLFGIQFPPLYATILSFVFMRVAIPLAIVGYCMQQIGIVFPIFPLTIS